MCLWRYDCVLFLGFNDLYLFLIYNIFIGVNSCYFVGWLKCFYISKLSCKDFVYGVIICVCWYGYKKDLRYNKCCGRCLLIFVCKSDWRLGFVI